MFTREEVATVVHLAKAWESMEVTVTNQGIPEDVEAGRFMQAICDSTAATLRGVARKMEALESVETKWAADRVREILEGKG